MPVADVAAGDDPLAIGCRRDLIDRAVATVWNERAARGRVPAVDRVGDRADERGAIGSEAQGDRTSVDLEPGVAGRGIEQPNGGAARSGERLAVWRVGERLDDCCVGE